MQLKHNKATWTPPKCCKDPCYIYLDRLPRQFRTSIGKVKINWRRLRCKCCGKTIIPLQAFLGIETYQSQTFELEKVVTEIVSEQSYRRSSRHLGDIGHIPVPKSTAHRWVVQSDCDKLDTGTETFDQLFADGTGYKKRCNKKEGTSNKGELRIALGVDKHGSVVPLGSWSGDSWAHISKDIKGKRTDQPVAEVFVSDGEVGLSHALAKLCNEHQRCSWHFVNDLNYTMWKDGASKSERNDKQKELISIVGIELPEEDFDKVSKEECQEIETRLEKAKKDIDELYNYLQSKGYHEAAKYINRGCDNVFTYINRWLRTGLITPRASSMIERMMREIARRLKRIAFGWSPKGAAKMARIIIKRFTTANQWKAYWDKKLRIDGNVIMALLSIKTA
jgi:hypothetical protein